MLRNSKICSVSSSVHRGGEKSGCTAGPSRTCCRGRSGVARRLVRACVVWLSMLTVCQWRKMRSTSSPVVWHTAAASIAYEKKKLYRGSDKDGLPGP